MLGNLGKGGVGFALIIRVILDGCGAFDAGSFSESIGSKEKRHDQSHGARVVKSYYILELSETAVMLRIE